MRTGAFILLIAALLIACKKYPEGGYKFQAKSLIQGEKELILYTVDGVDSLQYFFDTEFCGCTSRIFNFAIQSSSGAKRIIYGDTSCNGGTLGNAYWYLVDRKRSLKFDFAYKCTSSAETHFPFVKGNGNEWGILKLDKNELHITNSNSGKNYEILFKAR